MAEMPVSEALDSAEKAYSDAALAAPVADVAVDVTPVAEPKPAAKAKPAPKALSLAIIRKVVLYPGFVRLGLVAAPVT